jgi:hypothetical protein
MQHTDKSRFATLLCGVADYYGRELSNGVIGLYWQGLAHIDIDAVEKALWEHTQNPDAGQFMPKIADVTRAIHGRTTDQACIAWGKVDAAVRRIGSYADVVFDDALIHRVIAEMGGWIWLGQQRELEWTFIAKRFETIYRGYKMRSEAPDYPPTLVGLANAQNAREGFAAQPPMLIGHARRAQAVHLAGSDQPLLPMQRAGDILPQLKLAAA